MPEIECVWPIDSGDCCPPSQESPGDADLFERLVPVVSDMMTRWSGYRIGVCTAQLRPLGPCKVCRSWCCGGADGVLLRGPNGMYVASVTEVSVGGATLDPATWRFDTEKQTLWRKPPDSLPQRDARWAECGEADAFCVDAVLGEDPDAWALFTAAALLCELMKSCRGDKCRIPRNATQVTSQGLTITLSDSVIRKYLPEVNEWVTTVNPNGAMLPGRVWSPDLAPPGHGASSGMGSVFTIARGGSCCGG